MQAIRRARCGRTRTSIPAALAIVFVGAAACDESYPSMEANCYDGVDEDRDGLTDLEDFECGFESPESTCSDGVDNDLDGATDRADTDCGFESPEVSCADEVDNDLDGATDACDPDCPPQTEACDGEDNNCDGRTDETCWQFQVTGDDGFGEGNRTLTDLAAFSDGTVMAVGCFHRTGSTTSRPIWFLSRGDDRTWWITSDGTGCHYAVGGATSHDLWFAGGWGVHHGDTSFSLVSDNFYYRDLHARTASEVWFAGSSDEIGRWDGTTLRESSTGLDGDWNVVRAIAANNVWVAGAVADVPRLAHWNGTAWSLDPFTPVSGVVDLWAASASDVWAALSDGTLLRYDGRNWSASASGATALSAVSGTSSSDVWIAGVSGFSAHWDGSALQPGPGVRSAAYGDFGALSAVAPNDVYGVFWEEFIVRYHP